MYYLKLIFKNIFRHRLRSILTIVGLVVAILAFGLLQTVVNAWYAGADMASANRLVTRNATSLVFSLPAYYRERIKAIDGVTAVAISNWFGGVYKDQTFKNFFATFAVDHDVFFDLYPEFRVKPDELLAFKKDQRGCMVGRLIADQHGFKVGDVIPLTSPIYGGGTWELTVRGIYEPKDETTVTRQLYFHWDYMNEQMKKRFPKRAESAGVFIVQIADGSRAAEISQAIDREFRNSLAETLTETEKAFSLGFVAQTEAIVTAVKIVSFVVIVIIFAVVANTMAMTARERLAEYATLKALGFPPIFVAMLIFGESVLISALGGALGILLTFPVAAGFKLAMGTMFPVFYVTGQTVAMQVAASVAVGVLAGILPSIRAANVRIVDGLRYAG
ncbi:MAG TPA: ABC transporter permease [Usitatibacter sp.]|jgi:putative ABC transport system permease protein|nr:ABC transporter permease [Usitatibacter sp.]